MGDAVASFIERADPTTTNNCLSRFADFAGRKDYRGLSHHRAALRYWTCPQYRWKDVTSPKRRVVTICMFLVALIFVGALWGVGITALPEGASALQLGYGVVDPQTAIDTQSFPENIILKVTLANLPQIIFSFLDFSYNALFTATRVPEQYPSVSATTLCWTADLIFATGFGATQGAFREYYFKNPPFEGNQLVASIGQLIFGTLQSLSPFLLHLMGNYPHCRVYMIWAGMVLIFGRSFLDHGTDLDLLTRCTTRPPD
ncbi:hypothetical protein E8E11_001563 [Didymella keratinophila]|nr:hypothetical protein E8E11_001563 [Didymella keratinophila]